MRSHQEQPDKPQLALDTTEEDKTKMRENVAKQIPVSGMDIDQDLRDEPVKEWPSEFKRRKLLDDVPDCIKNKTIGEPVAEPAAVYFNDKQGIKKYHYLVCVARWIYNLMKSMIRIL